MMDFHPNPTLARLAPNYDALLCDIWGVIHDGRMPFQHAEAACRRFRAERGPVVLISNSPRPGAAIPAQFRQIGVGTDFYDAIVTSGDAIRAELSARAPGPAFKLGPDRDDGLYAGTGLRFSELDEATFLSCTGLFDDTRETPEDYRALLSEGANRRLTMVCANPDIQVIRGGQRVWCGGALAQLYHSLGGHVVLAGKPHPPIYRLAFDAVRAAAGRAVSSNRTLAVGDGPGTDLAGALRQGVDCWLITGSGLDAQNQTGARYLAPALTW
ncbi:MAG: TIGR01459 family HAD-type hydrolase [Maricaulaceae bacterium]